MPDAGVINTCRVTWPLMSRPRMLPAWVRTSSVLAANFTPPALPRPPIFTWDLTITGRPSRSAAATASSTVVTTVPSGAGTPWARNSSLAWYSYRSTWSPDASRGFAERSEHGSQEAPGARGPTTRPYRDRRSDGQSGWYEARHPAGSERGLSPADSAHPRPDGRYPRSDLSWIAGPRGPDRACPSPTTSLTPTPPAPTSKSPAPSTPPNPTAPEYPHTYPSHRHPTTTSHSTRTHPDPPTTTPSPKSPNPDHHATHPPSTR